MDSSYAKRHCGKFLQKTTHHFCSAGIVGFFLNNIIFSLPILGGFFINKELSSLKQLDLCLSLLRFYFP